MPCDYPSLTGPIRDRKSMDPVRALTGHHGPRATYKQIVRTFEIRWGRHDCLRLVCLRLFPNPAQHHHGPVRYPHVSVWFPPVYRTESVRFLRSRDQKHTENRKSSRMHVAMYITRGWFRTCTYFSSATDPYSSPSPTVPGPPVCLRWS